MHYAHVKRKEYPMKKLTIEAVRVNPEMLAVLHARARRARAEAVNNVFVRLIGRLTPRIDLRARGFHWG